jgi:hypothetical protein
MPNDEQIVQPHAAAEPPSLNPTIDQLFHDLAPRLRSLASDLPSADIDRIESRLRERLSRFVGTPNEFDLWVSRYVASYARYYARYYALRKAHAGIVRKKIWDVFNKSTDLVSRGNLADCVHVLENQTWAWAWLHVNSLSLGGTAKPSTRLGEWAHYQAMGWRKTCLRERDRFLDIDVNRMALDEGGAVFISPGFDDESDQPVRLVLTPRKPRKPVIETIEPPIPLTALKTRLFCSTCSSLEKLLDDRAIDPSVLLLACGHARARDITKIPLLKAA